MTTMLTTKTLENLLKDINGKRIYSGGSLLSIDVNGVVQYLSYDLNSLTPEAASSLIASTSAIQQGTIITYDAIRQLQGILYLTKATYASPGILNNESESWDLYQDRFLLNRFANDLSVNLSNKYVLSNVSIADIIGAWTFGDLDNIQNEYKYIWYGQDPASNFSFIGGTTQSRIPPRNKPFEFSTRADYSLRESIYANIRNELDARYAGSSVRVRTFATGLAEANTITSLSMDASSYPSVLMSGSLEIRMTLAENVMMNQKINQLAIKIIRVMVGEKIPWNGTETTENIETEILTSGSLPLISTLLLLGEKEFFTSVPDKQPWPTNPDCIPGPCTNSNQISYSYRLIKIIAEVVKFW